MSTLNESSLRRPEWTEGRKVVLGDGQEWTFPKAKRVLYPSRSAEGKIGISMSPPFGPEFHELSRAVDVPAGVPVPFGPLVTCAGTLLVRNYDLSDDQLGEILSLDLSEAIRPMWEAVYAVILDLNPPAA